ncbi:MAG: glycosyltransferase [Anaerolineales bacterium]|nr:glycosyltransferase [Anaerolineales bacterium]MCA9979077.1 glycosyltransferase [Anaerolineales bacterium]MCB8968214.1 glycosyltransferase [Ardenticatenaceae bacterium]
MEGEVSVIVPTRNEAHNVPCFLRSLPANVLLIVVDASDDETPTIIRRSRPFNTIIIRHPGNVTVARQIGAEAAITEWLLFTDADVLFDRDYFVNLSAHLQGDAVYGPKHSLDRFSHYYRWFGQGQQWMHRLGIPAASGSNLLIRRPVFDAIGGFDLRLTVNEDSEIAWRVKRQGYRIAFARDLVVYARDHRRLEYGRFRKTAHSLLRCALLYSGLMPARWRSHDWGYWKQRA